MFWGSTISVCPSTASGPFFICFIIILISAHRRTVNNKPKIINVVTTWPTDRLETAACTGMMSWMAHGWRPT